MQADEPNTGMRHDDTLPSVETTMLFLALCERYGSEESAVTAVVRGRRAGVPGAQQALYEEIAAVSATVGVVASKSRLQRRSSP